MEAGTLPLDGVDAAAEPSGGAGHDVGSRVLPPDGSPLRDADAANDGDAPATSLLAVAAANGSEVLWMLDHVGPRLQLWDRPANSVDARRLLGTAILWRAADPAVPTELVDQFRREVPVVEILAIRVAAGCGQERYPFSALLYEAPTFARYRVSH